MSSVEEIHFTHIRERMIGIKPSIENNNDNDIDIDNDRSTGITTLL